MTEPRIFKVDDPHMKGDDIQAFEKEIIEIFASMDIRCPLNADGVYDVATRSYVASLLHALGINATEAMKDGLTPALRTKIRHRDLDHVEAARFSSKEYVEYRRDLRERWAKADEPDVHKPVTQILADSWGYHPGVHDGEDVICKPDAVIFAMVKCKVIDVRPSGWWGLGAPSNATLKAQGDGIIQVEVLQTVGPFRKGMHIGYGHAEKARVKEGQIVEAGEPLGHAGFANAWHIHLMVNDGSKGTRGVGNIDPRPLVDYTKKHG